MDRSLEGATGVACELPFAGSPKALVTVRKQRSGLVEIQDIDVGAII